MFDSNGQGTTPILRAANTQPNLQPSFRLVLVSVIAAVIGIGAGVIAYLLSRLIAFFGNLFYFQRVSFEPAALQDNHLGILVIVVTVAGGLVVGLMAKFGSEKIKGHG